LSESGRRTPRTETLCAAQPIDEIPVVEHPDFADDSMEESSYQPWLLVGATGSARGQLDEASLLRPKGNVLMDAHGPWLSVVPF
jgi:hypothetical protein